MGNREPVRAPARGQALGGAVWQHYSGWGDTVTGFLLEGYIWGCSQEGEQGKQDKAGESANVWSRLGTSFRLILREALSINCSSGLG